MLIAPVPLPSCRVTCRDGNGAEQTAEVSAESLYEAVARGLAAFRNADWAGDTGRGQTTITVIVKQLEVERVCLVGIGLDGGPAERREPAVHSSSLAPLASGKPPPF